MQLKPVLGPVQLVFYGVGVIVGAGIYSVIGTAAGLAQHGLWLSFVLSAAVALLTAASYAEMATAFPKAGAEYIYMRQTWPTAEWLAFGIGIVILIGGTASASTVAVAFGGYLREFVDIQPVWSALILLAGCTALNIWGLRESSLANILFTVIEVSGLLLVIAAGLTCETSPQPTGPGSPKIVAAAALLFFVYLGFESIANLAEEVHRPARDIPLALFSSLTIVIVLYVLVALAVVRMAEPAALASSEAPLATAIEAVWPQLSGVLSAIALFATANTVLITIVATSRLAFSMARDREIHGVFAGLLPYRNTPWVASLLLLGMAAALLPLGGVRLLAEMASFAALVAFFAVNVAVIALRYRRPQHPRPFRVPGTVRGLPIVPLLALASISILLVHFDREIYVGGAVTLVVTAIAFVLRQWARRRR